MSEIRVSEMEEVEPTAGPNGCDICGVGPYETCIDTIDVEDDEESSTCRDCAVPLEDDFRDGRCGRCADEADALSDANFEDPALTVGEEIWYKDLLMTIDQVAEIGDRKIVQVIYSDSRGFTRYGILDSGPENSITENASVVLWGESQERAYAVFSEWTAAVREIAYADSVFSEGDATSETDSQTAISAEDRKNLTMLLRTWEEVAHPDHIEFYSRSLALAEAVAELLGTELNA